MSKLKTIFISSLLTFIIVTLVYAYFYSKSQDENVSDKINTAEIKDDSNSDHTFINAVQLDEANDSITKTRKNIITETVKEVSPAVVGINVTEIRQYRSPWSSDPFFRQFFGDKVYTQEVKSLGSGTIISPDGYIVTNDHVAGNAEKVIVTMTDGTQFDAKIIGSDQSTDICLLKIDAENLPYIKAGSSKDLLIGEWVIALGNPFGLFEINDKPTVTVGVISATGMNLGGVSNRYYLNMIQTDAAINGGNSGGPLVNSLGQLIGINTLIYSEGGGSVGVGFAIPIDKVVDIVREIKQNGKIDRDFWTGLRIQTIDEGIANYYHLSSTRGVIITHVVKNSPADEAGLEVGDIILEMDNFRINDDNSLIALLQHSRTGDTVRLKVKRDNQVFTKNLKLERRND